MIGGIIWVVGIAITGRLISGLIRKVKTSHPEAIKKHRILFILTNIILFFLGSSISIIIGGMANGAAITPSLVTVAVKVSLFVMVTGLLILFAKRVFKR